MKTTLAFILSSMLAASALAGPADYSKGGSIPPAPAPGCECFGAGFDLGFFGGGYLPTHSDHGLKSSLGGGVLAEYFFNEYIGIQGSYGAYATDPVHHVYGGDLVLRLPIKEACIAPYILAGGGGDSDGTTRGYWDVGGGLEARFPSLHCMGLFADGAYHFTEHSRDDYTLVRVGVKFRF